tara:strand:+ start:4191 stop:4430 length:240 start_codon:yes stop_codon:yes gene_type:complete
MATRKKTESPAKLVNKTIPKGGALDQIISKVTSRKLLVWLTGSALLYTGGLQSSDWVAISLVYIGGQAAVDLAVAWKKA